MVEIYRKILDALSRDEAAALCTVTQSAGSAPQKAGSKMLVYQDGQIDGTIGGGTIEHATIEQALEVLEQGGTRLFKAHLSRDLAMCCGGRMEILIEPIGNNPWLILFGGGHVGKALCAVANQAGFRVHVVDEREEHCDAATHPAAESFTCAVATDVLDELPWGPDSYAVIVTHSHRLDEELLAKCVDLPYRYLGMIGSRAKVRRFLGRYRKRGIGLDGFTQVRAPIGLDIGALEPGEIAVSIVAEMVAVRRGGDTGEHPSLTLCSAEDSEEAP
jgi:xanthine dehydrogenase accessory factor